MTRVRSLQSLVAGFVLLGAGAAPGAMQSASYNVPVSVLAGGGGAAASASYRLEATLGQPGPIGISSGASAALAAGFRYAVEEALLPDTDGDGVVDPLDAFPTDPAASVDTDGDGMPDDWNPGVTPEEIAASSLTLDAFPLDPVASVDADGDGFPEAWNPGRTAADSTTGLVLDVYPNDPSRAFPIAVLSGVPLTPTALVRATVAVGGRDITAYRYRVDGGAWSAKRAVALPIAVSGLAAGPHTLDVLGRDAAGNWQPTTWATRGSWRVSFGFLGAVQTLLLEP